MNEYLNKKNLTNEIIDNEEWLYTDDKAKYLDDENITILGRYKEMIIRGAYNIYPVDIEDVILKNIKVQQVAVVGKDHDVIGEQTVAFTVPKAGEELTRNNILQKCSGQIVNYKIPVFVHFITQMPIILAGKIKKAELKDWAENGIPNEIQL